MNGRGKSAGNAPAAGASAADVSANYKTFQKIFLKTKMLQKKCEIFHEIFQNQKCFTKSLEIFREIFENFFCSFFYS